MRILVIGGNRFVGKKPQKFRAHDDIEYDGRQGAYKKAKKLLEKINTAIEAKKAKKEETKEKTKEEEEEEKKKEEKKEKEAVLQAKQLTADPLPISAGDWQGDEEEKDEEKNEDEEKSENIRAAKKQLREAVEILCLHLPKEEVVVELVSVANRLK